MHAEHSLEKHRQKNDVHAYERRPEMHFAPKLIHGTTGGLGEPIVDSGEEREDRPRRDDVVEVRNDIIGVVQVKIGGIERKRNTR